MFVLNLWLGNVVKQCPSFFFPNCNGLLEMYYLCIVERKNDKIDQNI